MKITVVLLVLVVVIYLPALLLSPKLRKRTLLLFGMLRVSPGDHRCFRCDLYDDDRSACLVMFIGKKGSSNLKIPNMFCRCAWRGKMSKYVQVLSVDNAKDVNDATKNTETDADKAFDTDEATHASPNDTGEEVDNL